MNILKKWLYKPLKFTKAALKRKKTNYVTPTAPVEFKDYVPKNAIRVTPELIRTLINNGQEEYWPIGSLDKETVDEGTCIFFSKLFGFYPNIWVSSFSLMTSVVDAAPFREEIAKKYSTKVTNDGKSYWFYFNKKEAHTFTDEFYAKGKSYKTEQFFGFDKEFWVLDKDLIMATYNNKVVIAYKNGCFPNDIIDLLDKYSCPKFEKKPKKTRELYVITAGGGGLDLERLYQKKGFMDDKTFYNDDFAPIDTKIQAFLKDSGSGLVILHGTQGTGKTSYIRGIMRNTRKKVVYVPAGLTSQMASPSFIHFTIENLEDSILVIEDCEQLLMPRDNGKSFGINDGLVNLLNMTDGILGDSLNIKVICTFNTDMKNIDPALLRKGRLKMEYEFKKLTYKKGKDLNERFALNIPEEELRKGMTLAELFNYDYDNNITVAVKHEIGFNAKK